LSFVRIRRQTSKNSSSHSTNYAASLFLEVILVYERNTASILFVFRPYTATSSLRACQRQAWQSHCPSIEIALVIAFVFRPYTLTRSNSLSFPTTITCCWESESGIHHWQCFWASKSLRACQRQI